MARRVQLVACMVACMAVTSLALEMCPEKSSYNGCRRRGCVSLESTRRSPTVVCDACGEGYQLTSRGTRMAKCECAPGFAGKGNSGICKRCPEGTDVAAGGSVVTSECLQCPAGTSPSHDATEGCTCPAGHYRVTLSRAEQDGFAPVACKMCAGRTQYITGNLHTSRTCSTCPSGQVANVAHTWCVEPTHPDAIPEPRLPGLNVTLSNLQEAFANGRSRVDEARIAQADSLTESMAGVGNPMARLGEGLTKLVSGEGSLMPQLPSLGSLNAPKLPSMAELTAELGKLNLTDLASKNLADIKLQDLAKLNLTSLARFNVEDLASNFNLTSLADLAKAAQPRVDMQKVVERLGEGLAAVFPTLPDPLYVTGLRLDPSALADAGLPAAGSVPELFGSLMRTTIGDLDTTDWQKQD